jgi:transcriptional regulator with XRE-family HTH domain
MAKSAEKLKARSLRKQGNSIKEIAKKLNVSVSSVSDWCRDIRLSEDQIKKLEKRMRDPYYGQRLYYLQKIKAKTEKKITRLKNQGKRRIGLLSQRDIFIAGVALYWAEGFKKDKQIGFANCDPIMINFFISWLIRCLNIKPKDIKLRITINQAYIPEINNIQQYWSNITGIPLKNFQKPTIQRVKWSKQYENKNDYKGVLRIRINKSLSNLRRILGMIDKLGSLDLNN